MIECDDLNRAVVLFFGDENSPCESVANIQNAFPGSVGSRLAAQVLDVVAEFDRIPTNWDVETLPVAERRVLAEISASHPCLTLDSLNALRWYFSFTWK
ncbi:MAG: hypothetical protein JWN70_3305 [Planctomycetaceae bacterium]|nr:hypothetical protein [Planctomycetaceae bacterium]